MGLIEFTIALCVGLFVSMLWDAAALSWSQVFQGSGYLLAVLVALGCIREFLFTLISGLYHLFKRD